MVISIKFDKFIKKVSVYNIIKLGISKMNKRGLELSINAIVILIIAIVFLGIVLAFVNGVFGDLSTKLKEKML